MSLINLMIQTYDISQMLPFSEVDDVDLQRFFMSTTLAFEMCSSRYDTLPRLQLNATLGFDELPL